jgi:hypothetical protein
MNGIALGHRSTPCRWLVATATACALGAVGCGDDEECELGALSRDLGGIGLNDCRIADEDSLAQVDRCAVMAYREGKPFRALYEQPDGGLDALVCEAGERCQLLSQSRIHGPIERFDCANSHVAEEAGRTYVACDEPGEARVVCE